jgi:hypothetical protein
VKKELNQLMGYVNNARMLAKHMTMDANVKHVFKANFYYLINVWMNVHLIQIKKEMFASLVQPGHVNLMKEKRMEIAKNVMLVARNASHATMTSINVMTLKIVNPMFIILLIISLKMLKENSNFS